MKNYDKYDEWNAVCDDPELIANLIEQGVDPGTEEFENLLGVKYKVEERTNPKDSMILIVTLALPILGITGMYKLIKFVFARVKQCIRKKRKKEGS